MVFSQPRSWLGWDDIATAFTAARLRLTDYHMVAVFKLIELFNADTFSLRRTEVVELSAERIRHYKHIHIEAESLRLFLVHLRVTTKEAVHDAPSGSDRRPLSWERWAGRKAAKRIQEQAAKPAEFEKALAGNAHSLTRDELQSHVKEFAIIPEETLNALVSIQVEKWVLDADSRRDYIHRSAIELERWIKRNKLKPKGLSHELLAKARKEIKDNLMASKRRALLSAEDEHSALSLELFSRFDKISREGGYNGGSTWAEWLGKQIAQGTEQVSRLKQSKSLRLEAALKAKKLRFSVTY